MERYFEVGINSADETRLVAFYDRILTACFPDDNERESMANIRRFLELKKVGWYGASNYHVLVLEKDGQIVGGSISDYLAVPNAGVLEFLAVAPEWRGQGLASALLAATEGLLNEDARSAHHASAGWLFCEMDDPSQAKDARERETSETRARIWAGWGFHHIDFPYVQPALDPEKSAVAHLKLLVKPAAGRAGADIDSPVLVSVLHEYMRLAMRIDSPSTCPEFQRMAAIVAGQQRIPVLPMVA